MPTLRRRSPAGLCVLQAQATNTSGLLSPASKHLQKITEHELVDMGAVARAGEPAHVPSWPQEGHGQDPKGGVCLCALHRQKAKAAPDALWAMPWW